MMSVENLDTKAEKALRDVDAYRVPIPIHIVAQRLNVTVEALPLGSVSGMLIVRNNQGAIGYNSAHARVRQRFTIAHEIAHFVLHGEPNSKPRLFIDEHVVYRTGKSVSAKVSRREVEANQFGSALLMPEELVENEVRNRNLNLADDEAISFLARQFWVSVPAVANRLLRLGLLRYPINF